MHKSKVPQLHPLDVAGIILFSLAITSLVLPIAHSFGLPNTGVLFFFTTTLFQDGLFLLTTLLFLLILRRGRLADIYLRKTNFRGILSGLTAGVGIYFLLVVFVLFLNSLWPGGLPPQNVETFLQPGQRGWEIALVFLTIGFIAPVVEEILFRGYLFVALDRHVPTVGAMILSAIIFSLIHGDLARALPLAIGGLVLNALVWRYKSLLPAILAHSTWNTCMVIVYYATVS